MQTNKIILFFSNMHYFIRHFLILLIIATFVSLLTLGDFSDMHILMWRFCYVLSLLLFFYLIRPQSFLHTTSLETNSKSCLLVLVAVLLLLFFALAVLMTVNPSWGQGRIQHHNQYEELASALLEGHLYIDKGNISQDLLNMDNPYDLKARKALKVKYEWDHAFYNGHYYMYFGVIPCVLFFVPFQLIFQQPLRTVYVTQLFSMLIVSGIFYLFFIVARKYCRCISWGLYILLSAALSCICVIYFVCFPELYCTAISGGVCFALWGFIFLFRALVLEEPKKLFWRDLILGATFSACIFGCRPPVGMFCITYIPMGVQYICRHRKELKHIIHVVLMFCLPFFIVAALLMLYNYARFDNPFEFGQSYQLTLADQRYLKDMWGNFDLVSLLVDIFDYLFKFPLHKEAPHFQFGGLFIQFPILLCSFFVVDKKNYDELKKAKLEKIYIGLFISLLVVMTLDNLWAPIFCWRYTTDFAFILSIMTIFSTCFYVKTIANTSSLSNTSFRLSLLSVFAIIICVAIFFIPYDSSFPQVCPEQAEKAIKFLLLR